MLIYVMYLVANRTSHRLINVAVSEVSSATKPRTRVSGFGAAVQNYAGGVQESLSYANRGYGSGGRWSYFGGRNRLPMCSA